MNFGLRFHVSSAKNPTRRPRALASALKWHLPNDPARLASARERSSAPTNVHENPRNLAIANELPRTSVNARARALNAREIYWAPARYIKRSLVPASDGDILRGLVLNESARERPRVPAMCTEYPSAPANVFGAASTASTRGRLRDSARAHERWLARFRETSQYLRERQKQPPSTRERSRMPRDISRTPVSAREVSRTLSSACERPRAPSPYFERSRGSHGCPCRQDIANPHIRFRLQC